MAFVDIGDPPASSHNHHKRTTEDDNDNDSGSGSDFGSEWELEQVDKDKDRDKNREDKGDKWKEQLKAGEEGGDSGNHDTNNNDDDDDDDDEGDDRARGCVLTLCDEPRPLLCVLDVLSLSGKSVVTHFFYPLYAPLI